MKHKLGLLAMMASGLGATMDWAGYASDNGYRQTRKSSKRFHKNTLRNKVRKNRVRNKIARKSRARNRA